MSDATNNMVGTILACGNPDCGCRLCIEQPCPHGSAYRCACGYRFEHAGDFPLADANR